MGKNSPAVAEVPTKLRKLSETAEMVFHQEKSKKPKTDRRFLRIKKGNQQYRYAIQCGFNRHEIFLACLLSLAFNTRTPWFSISIPIVRAESHGHYSKDSCKINSNRNLSLAEMVINKTRGILKNG